MFTENKYWIKSGNHEIDKNKVKEYLDKFEDNYWRNIARKIIENTNYVKFDTMLINIKQAFSKFAKTIGNNKFHICKPLKKGSEGWIMNMLEDETQFWRI